MLVFFIVSEVEKLITKASIIKKILLIRLCR